MKNTFLGLFVSIFLVACPLSDFASQLPDNRPNYKKTTVTNPLEIPPDLTQSSIDDTLSIPELSGIESAELSQYQNERNSNFQNKNNLENSLKRIYHQGDTSWIEIDSNPNVVFKNAKDFWTRNGLSLSRADKNIGIMETVWLEADDSLPSTNAISRLLSTALGNLKDSGMRDKFRTRVDYDGKKTLVYLTHYSATEKEVTRGKSSINNKDIENYTWVASSRNPELEIEMLRRLNLYLNQHGNNNVASDAPAKEEKPPILFTQLKDGTPALLINGDFYQAWALLGIAIDRAGYTMDIQDRKNGTYHFAKITAKEKGFFIKEIKHEIDNYTVGLADQGQQQIAVVRTHNQKSIGSEEAKTILQKISQAISF